MPPAGELDQLLREPSRTVKRRAEPLVSLQPSDLFAPVGQTLWLSYPVAWIVYELIRGAITRKYHYPFVNPANGGYGAVAFYAVAILIVMLIFCSVVVWLGNVRSASAAAPRTT